MLLSSLGHARLKAALRVSSSRGEPEGEEESSCWAHITASNPASEVRERDTAFPFTSTTTLLQTDTFACGAAQELTEEQNAARHDELRREVALRVVGDEVRRCLFVTSHCPFTGLSLAFRRHSLTFHCLSLALSPPFRDVPLPFHCLVLGLFTVRSAAFR